MIVLNQAEKIMLGTREVQRVYAGAQQVWPKIVPLPPYIAAVLADNPVGFWPLDETSGTVAHDLAGENPGTYAGTFTLGQEGPDGRPAFSAAGLGRVVVPGSFPAPTATGSLEIWARHTGVGATGTFFNRQPQTTALAQVSPFSSHVIMNTGGGGVRFGNGTTITGLSNGTVGALPGLAWNHAVVTWSASGGVQMYANGQPDPLSYVGPFNTAQIADGGQPLIIGQATNGADAFSNGIIGRLAYAAVYDYALTAQQIAAHHAAAQP